MSRLPRINPRDLRDHADQARIDRIWGRVRRDLPAASRGSAGGAPSGAGLVRRPARTGRLLLWAAALGGVFGVGLLVGSSQLELSTSDDPEAAAVDSPLSDVFAAGTRQRTFALPGGGRLVLQPESLVEVVEVRDGNVRLHLLRGRASLDASMADMSFAVVAGEATTVAPAGSVVSLSRLDTDVDVAVDRGSVEVLSPSGRRVINGGEASRVSIVASVSSTDESPVPPVVAHQRPPQAPDAASTDPNRSPADAASTDGEPVAAVSPPQPEAAPSWFALWDKDKLDDAARVLEERGGISSAITAAQSVRELMALYEIAAMKGRHDLANAALRRVADEFPSDPNGAVAANTLANTYERMGKADLAAKYRAQAMQSQRLSETLLCSQLSGAPRDTVEARRKAKALALEYLQRFADGTSLDDAKAAIDDAAGDPAADPPKDAKQAPPSGSSSADADKSPDRPSDRAPSEKSPSGEKTPAEKAPAEKSPAEKHPESPPQK